MVGKWQVCVDYTNLNDVCLKDNFLLPRIDQIVNSTAEHGMLSFLDAFSRYHQISMFQSDEEKITFVTLHGLYYYKYIQDKEQKLVYYVSKAMIDVEIRELMEQAICLNFFAANNEVEYEVVLVRLDLALVLAATKLEIRSDYQLIVEQIQREYEVPREENGKTDALAEIATILLIKEVVTLPIYLKAAPSITPEPVSNTSQMDSGWMLNIVK
ncbi:hypothetical protein CK203_107169 [Vitis vinifera]|uniref:Transposon Ty3-I Gag-Pol polyprotein n=1 Tax=Vitis vinifera TaxID=29760 RepID=A0A438CSX3_VITVI|nr:hypothetical protein CK203_107169 [Vitis vinifera]